VLALDTRETGDSGLGAGIAADKLAAPLHASNPPAIISADWSCTFFLLSFVVDPPPKKRDMECRRVSFVGAINALVVLERSCAVDIASELEFEEEGRSNPNIDFRLDNLAMEGKSALRAFSFSILTI